MEITARLPLVRRRRPRGPRERFVIGMIVFAMVVMFLNMVFYAVGRSAWCVVGTFVAGAALGYWTVEYQRIRRSGR